MPSALSGPVREKSIWNLPPEAIPDQGFLFHPREQLSLFLGRKPFVLEAELFNFVDYGLVHHAILSGARLNRFNNVRIFTPPKRCIMKIKQIETWPPRVGGEGVEVTARKMSDTVLGVVVQVDKINSICFKMQGNDDQEYSLYLFVPESLLSKIILTVTPHGKVTLEQMGELEIVGF
jgi:hypothetical protein